MSWLEEMLARQSRIAGGDGQAERLRQRLREAAAVRGSETEEPRAAPPEQRRKARGLLARLAARAGLSGSVLPRAAEKARAKSAAEARRQPEQAEESMAEETMTAEAGEDAAEAILQSLPRQTTADALPQAQTLAADGPQSMSQCGAAEAAALSRLYERDARRYDGGFEFPL